MNEVWKERKTHLLQFWKLNCTDIFCLWSFSRRTLQIWQVRQTEWRKRKRRRHMWFPTTSCSIKTNFVLTGAKWATVLSVGEKKALLTKIICAKWLHRPDICQVLWSWWRPSKRKHFLSKWGGQRSGDKRQEKYSMYPHLSCSLFMNSERQHVAITWQRMSLFSESHHAWLVQTKHNASSLNLAPLVMLLSECKAARNSSVNFTPTPSEICTLTPPTYNKSRYPLPTRRHSSSHSLVFTNDCLPAHEV